jgi:hypothetical protein
MLERKGERSVNGYIIDSSSHLTTVLAVSMSGVKLPAYIIFKVVQGGWVWAKFDVQTFHKATQGKQHNTVHGWIHQFTRIGSERFFVHSSMVDQAY